VGARGMHDLCAQIEESAEAGAGVLVPLVRGLLDEYGQVRAELEAEQRRARPAAPRVGS
jgi:hypothetical protein